MLLGVLVDQKQHPIPGRFKLIRQVRDLRNVVRDCHILATYAREDRQVSGRSQVRAVKSLAPDLQFDTEQRVLDADSSRRLRSGEFVRPRAQTQNALRVDVRKPLVSQLLLDVFGNLGGLN